MTPKELAEMKRCNETEEGHFLDEVVALIAAYEAEVAKVAELEAKVERLKSAMMRLIENPSVGTYQRRPLENALRAEGLLPESAVRG